MTVIECHFEFGGFDDHLVKGGISVYLWNLCRQFRDAGVPVSGLTAAHGLLPRLRDRYDVTDLDWHDDRPVTVPLDPVVWGDAATATTFRPRTTAHRLRADGIDVVLLDDPLLAAYPDTFYPPYEAKGRDLSFLKPLVFQVAATRYLRATARPGTLVHLHEPYYHYLMPSPLARAGLPTVSTVQSNMPVNKKVYGPEVRALLAELGGDPALADDLADPPLDEPWSRAMRAVLPVTRLWDDYRPDHVSVLGLVARSAAALDFLCDGQREHVVTHADTPLEELFGRLAVRRELRARPERLVVGGCAVGDGWLDVERDPDRRKAVLTGLDLDPELPTIYHNARWAVGHKGQVELATGLHRLLDSGERANVLLHCLTSAPPASSELGALAAAYPGLVRLETRSMARTELVGWACASDLCLYPSKFEMDTFLLAMGEAMACGAVPIATAQRGMRHFGHSANPETDPEATGLTLPRSFRVDDDLLSEAVRAGTARMLGLVRDRPELVAALRERAIRRARTLSWDRVADRFTAVFDAVRAGALPPPDPATLLHRGWADLLTDEQVRELGPVAAATAARRGDADLALRVRPGATPDWAGLFDAARRRVDLRACRRVVELSGSAELDAALAGRGELAGTAVRWSFAPAARVEAVPAGGRELLPLTAGPDGFTGVLPGPPPSGVALLVSLPDGRTGWDWLAGGAGA